MVECQARGNEIVTNQEKVLSYLQERREASVGEMARAFGLAEKEVRNAIDGLRRRHGYDFIENVDYGSTRFRLGGKRR